MRTTLLTLTIALALSGCDDAAKTDDKAGKTDGKAKTTTTAKKELKIPAKADSKTETKPDTKPDTKAEPTPETPTGTTKTGAPDGADAIAKLASLAKEIAAKPDEADAILEKAGMDRLAFEAAMVDVAKDEWKTDLYLTALTQPS